MHLLRAVMTERVALTCCCNDTCMVKHHVHLFVSGAEATDAIPLRPTVVSWPCSLLA